MTCGLIVSLAVCASREAHTGSVTQPIVFTSSAIETSVAEAI